MKEFLISWALLSALVIFLIWFGVSKDMEFRRDENTCTRRGLVAVTAIGGRSICVEER